VSSRIISITSRLVGLAALVAMMATSCGVEAATEYSVDNKDSFLAACADEDTDPILQQRLCQCVFEEAEASMAFERFVEINDLLADAPGSPLPRDLLELVASCVVEEADL